MPRWIDVFGRVPFFYYVLHIPFIHAVAVVVSAVRQGAVSPWLFANHPMGNPPPPEGYTWDLGLLYGVWAVVVVVLYFPSRWFAEFKARRKDWWLSYLQGPSRLRSRLVGAEAAGGLKGAKSVAICEQMAGE